jgi:hypothetical protein
VCRLGTIYKQLDHRLASLDTRSADITGLAAAKPWYPRGWYEYSDDASVAWRWRDKASCVGDYFGSACWGMDVLAEDGCDDLYVEVTILDRGDNAIDYANDALSGLQPGEIAKLSFESFNEAAASARLSEINCY